MSPTIPRVLVLSILLLPPTTRAEDLMDPFALVRQTLKYWRRIYNMYHEEVTLGYCWAEYFLQLGESMETVPMSRHASQGARHAECTNDEGCKKGDTLSREKREVWGASVVRGQRVRNKRYSGISNPTSKDVREISIVPGNSAERSDDISKVYSKRKGDFRWVKYGDGMFHLGTDKNCELSGSDNVTSFLPLLFNPPRGKSSKYYKEAKACTPESQIFRVYLNSGDDSKSIDCQDQVPNHIQRQGSLTFSHFLTSWLKGCPEGSSRSFIQNRTKGSFPSPAISNNKQHFKYNLKRINLGEHGLRRFQRQRNHEYLSTDSVERSSTSSPFFSNNFQEISELAAEDSASTDVPAKLDLKSTEDSSMVDVSPGNDRSPLRDSTKIARSPFDLKFKGTRAAGEREVSGKSTALEVDTRRKVLYPRTGRAGSGSSSRRASPPQLFQPEGQKPLGFRAPPRWIAPFESPFKSRDTINELDDNTEPADFHRDTNFDSPNSGFPRARRRPGVFEGSQRRSLRRRRDANDGTRGAFLRPLSKNEAPVRSSTYFDKFLRYPPSSVYTESGRNVRGRKIGSRSLEPRDSDAGVEAGRRRPKYIGRSFAESAPMIHSKYYPNIRAREPRSFLYTDDEMALGVNGFFDIPPSFNGPLFNYVSLKSPTESGWEGRGKRKGDSSKQLWIVRDNLYQRTKGSFLREKSVAGEAEEMEPDRYPVGGPSLLPDSYPRFMGDYGSPTSGTSRNSRPSRSSRAKDQGRWSLGGEIEARGAGRTWLFDFRAALMGFLKALGFFVQVGRQIMDYVDSNPGLTCTRDYLWSKAIQWIEA